MPKIIENLDFVNLMTYDMHGSWETRTGHHSPLYSRQGEDNGQELLNVVSYILVILYVVLHLTYAGYTHIYRYTSTKVSQS